MKIRFAFHKPLGERGVGKAIVAWTWFLGLFYNWRVLKYNYSHVEVWLPNSLGKFKMYGKITGECFSSTTRGDAEGVRFAPAYQVIGKHPERWDRIEVDVDEERLEVAVEEARRLVGAKYDYLGLFGFMNPFAVQDDKRWYCSEICDWFACLLGIYPERHKRISPRRAAYLLAQRFGEPKPVA